jgi:hypothetical protein
MRRQVRALAILAVDRLDLLPDLLVLAPVLHHALMLGARPGSGSSFLSTRADAVKAARNDSARHARINPPLDRRFIRHSGAAFPDGQA